MNTFGSPTLQFGLCSIDPSTRGRFRRDAIPELARVNSFYCPIGRYASRGWILLPRFEYRQLDAYATNLQLTLGTLTLKNLSIMQAQCATRGLASDLNALYLVELTDVRGVVSNKWFQQPTSSNYNVRAPAYPDTFYPNSLNGGTTWTWTTMVGDLWSQLGLGAYAGLPYAPLGTPEGFWLFGTAAWKALNDVLEMLGMTVACDPVAGAYSVVDAGAADAVYQTLQTASGAPLEDLEWLDVGAARVPKTVTVYFRRRNSVYGTEETVRYGSEQWAMGSFYAVPVTAPARFANAVGKHFLWSDFTVRYDQDGAPLAADVALATAIASERVSQYYGAIYGGTIPGFTTQVYAGSLPFATGSQVDGVCWKLSPNGWQTTIVHGPYPPWEGLWT